jgi:hypothetical protein
VSNLDPSISGSTSHSSLFIVSIFFPSCWSNYTKFSVRIGKTFLFYLGQHDS